MCLRPPKTSLQTMKGLIEIEPATTDDSQELFDLFQEVLAEECFFASLVEDNTRTEQIEKELLQNIEQSDYIALVAKCQNMIVGSLYLVGGRLLRTSHVVELEMKITKQFRGLGIGKRILNIAIYLARQKTHISKIKLSVVEHNKGAVALYKKLGFVQEGVLHREFREITGEYRDIICMGMEV